MSSFLDFTGLSELATKLKAYFMKKPTSAVGNSSTPVYVDANGNVQECTPSQMNVGKVNGYTVEKSVPSNAVFTDTTYPKAVKTITRSGTTFTATCYDGTTFTFTQQDNNTTYNFSGTTFRSGNQNTEGHDCNSLTDNGLYYYTSNGPSTSLGASTNDGSVLVQSYSSSWVSQLVQDYRNGNIFVRGRNNGTWTVWKKVDAGTVNGYTVEKSVPSNAVFTDTNTWRGIQNNLTSDSTTDSLSAAQGKALATGSARDSTKVPLSGASTINGQFRINPDSSANNYSEGARFNKAPNGWSCLMIGSNRDTTNGSPEENGGWFVGCNTNEQFVVGNKDSSTNNAAIWIDTNRKVYFPSGINGYSQTSHTHSVKINGSTKTVAASGGTAVDLGYMLEILQTSAGSSAAYNLNTMTSNGVYFMNINASSSTGAPGNGRYTIIVLNSGGYVTQLAFGYYFRIRVNTGSKWKSWVTIAELGNA